MNLLSPERRDQLKQLFLLGYSHRQIESATGISKATIVRYAKEFQAGASCPCGGKAGHRGWCWWRYEFSPSRGEWMREKWKARGAPDVQARCGEALDAAKAKGHDPGPLLWTNPTSTSLAFFKCRVCSAMGYVKRGAVVFGHVDADTYRDEARLEGRMFSEQCVSAEERETRRKAAEEKRSWREAKAILQDIKRHLRSPSPRRGYTPALNLLR